MANYDDLNNFATTLKSGLDSLSSVINTKQTNATNTALAQSQQDWLEKMYDKNNEYNSIGQQIQRGLEAGVNPAAIVGQNYSSATSSMPSPFQRSNNERVNYGDLAAIGQSNASASLALAQKRNMDAQTEYTQSKTNEQNIINKYKDLAEANNVKLTDAQVNSLKANTDVAYETLEKIKADTAQSLQQVKNLDAQEQSQRIENLFKSREMDAICNKLEAEASLSKQESEYYVAQLLSTIGLQAAQAYSSRMSGDLSHESIKQVNAMASLINSQDQAQIYQTQLDYSYSDKERKEGLKSLEWNNGVVSRGINALSSVSSLILGFLVGKAGK